LELPRTQNTGLCEPDHDVQSIRSWIPASKHARNECSYESVFFLPPMGRSSVPKTDSGSWAICHEVVALHSSRHYLLITAYDSMILKEIAITSPNLAQAPALHSFDGLRTIRHASFSLGDHASFIETLTSEIVTN
jgi:hypothetical protein